MSFERIVRAFETPVSLNPVRLQPFVTVEPGAAKLLAWGQTGAIATPVEQNIDFTVQKTEVFREVRRNDRTRRVKNPDDPSQFIDVKDPKEIIMNKSDPNSAKSDGTTQTNIPLDFPQGDWSSYVSPDGRYWFSKFSYKDQPLTSNEEIISEGPAREVPLDPGNSSPGSTPL